MLIQNKTIISVIFKNTTLSQKLVVRVIYKYYWKTKKNIQNNMLCLYIQSGSHNSPKPRIIVRWSYITENQFTKISIMTVVSLYFVFFNVLMHIFCREGNRIRSVYRSKILLLVVILGAKMSPDYCRWNW